MNAYPLPDRASWEEIHLPAAEFLVLNLRDLLEQRLGLCVILHPGSYAIVQVSRHENLSVLAALPDDEIKRDLSLAH